MVPHLIAWVEREGGDASRMRQVSGRHDTADPDARIPERDAEVLWDLASRETGDPAAGIHVADTLPRGTLDLVEYAFRSSANLAVGLERLARYSRALNERVAARTESNHEMLLWVVRDVGNSRVHPARTEFAMAIALKLARDGTGVDISPRQVCFAHPAPADDRAHRQFFRGPIRFDAGLNSLLLDARDAERPLLDADDALAGIVRRRLDKLLAAQDARKTGALSSRVRRFLVEAIGHTAVTPERTAQALMTSPRTLSRRLAEEGTSFRDLHDEVRADFARVLLQDRRASIADVSFFLDYSEPAAFHRAFRRWTGTTPHEYRAV